MHTLSAREIRQAYFGCVRVRVDFVGGVAVVVVIVAATNRMKRTRFGLSPIRCGGFFYSQIHLYKFFILYTLNKQDREK